MADIETGLRKTLNRHGYGFHYATLKRGAELRDSRESPWVFQASELPVRVRGQNTRIDFVLQLSDNGFVFMVAECKRANPALSNWCFARAPYTVRNRSGKIRDVRAESLRVTHEETVKVDRRRLLQSKQAYDVAVEVKADKPGDPHGGGGRDTIENAASQVCRGLNGLIEFMRDRPETIPQARHRGSGTYIRRADLVPVIFTTAQIWTTDQNLGEASLKDGKLDDDLKVQKKGWIWYRYPLSPALKHSVNSDFASPELARVVDREFTTMIAIVSPSGLDDFLTTEWWD